MENSSYRGMPIPIKKSRLPQDYMNYRRVEKLEARCHLAYLKSKKKF